MTSIAHGETSPINLSAGWNFVSFPKLPSDTNVATVLNDISSNVRIVWGYDNQTEEWKKWKPSTLCSSPSALCSIEGGKGYWVYMNASGSIDLSSWTTQSTTVSLTEGWNLIGYNGTDNTAVTDALSSISGKWAIIWNWTDGQWSAKHATEPLTTIPSINTLKQGKAYWIKTTQAVEWNQTIPLSLAIPAGAAVPLIRFFKLLPQDSSRTPPSL